MRPGIVISHLITCLAFIAGLPATSRPQDPVSATYDDSRAYPLAIEKIQSAIPNPSVNTRIAEPIPALGPPRPSQPQYAVDGLALGENAFISPETYRQFQCSPSQQFATKIWCTRKRPSSEPRGKFEVSNSLMHGPDGTLVYINHFQSLAYWTDNEAQNDIKRYSRKMGLEPNIVQMPSRPHLPQGILASWGKVALEPLDEQSVAALAEGRSIKKGLMVDYLGDFARSARERAPIYQIAGGPGFVWVASFNDAGQGTLRFFAVDASAFSEHKPDGRDSVHLAAATPVPRDLQRSQRVRDELFKNLATRTKKYTFKYVVIELPAGSLPSINYPIPVSFIRYDSAVLFSFDHYSLDANAEIVVSEFAKTLKKDSAYRSIVVVGHTDFTGGEDYNERLSKNRALTVAAALSKAGVPEKYLGVIPMGKRQPVASNYTPEGQALNRRVEFFISDVAGAPEIVIEHIPYNPCHLREDCAAEPGNIPVLSPRGDPKGEVFLRRALPTNQGADFVRRPLPQFDLTRRSLKDLEIQE